MVQGNVNLCFTLEIAAGRHDVHLQVSVEGRPFAMTFSPLRGKNTPLSPPSVVKTLCAGYAVWRSFGSRGLALRADMAVS
jgi:hypothetical protein